MADQVMGVKRKELPDEVTVGGVATCMDRAKEVNVNLFIWCANPTQYRAERLR